jgi:hypothetical protein
MKLTFKSLIAIAVIITILISSCQKTPVDYSKDINDLKALVTELQHRSDSLAAALSNTNTNLSNLSKSVDSIKVKLTDIQTQIDALTLSLTTANENIAAINAQLVLLNQQYASLLAQLNAILALLNTAPPTLQDGLLAYFPFTGNANDSSGNGNNGTVTGVNLTSDRFGNLNSAYSFNGLNSWPNTTPDSVQEISIDNTFIPLGSDYTISLWMKTTDNTKMQQCLFNSINHTGFIVEFHNNNNLNKLMYGVGNSINYWDIIHISGTYSTFQNDIWHHVIFIKSASTYTLYVDGNFDGSSSVSQSSAYSSSVGLRIGSIGGGYEVFHGTLDDVSVYNRTLTQSEITYLATH